MGPVPLHPSRGSAAGRARINRLRFALALIATGQLTLAETVAHRSNCVKIAVQATRAFIFMAPCSPRVPRRPRPRSAARTLASCTTKRRARRAPLPPARAPAAAAPRARAGAAQLWAERIRAGDPDFNLGKAVLKVDSRALQLARDACDKEENVSHASASAAPLGVVFSSGPPRSRAGTSCPRPARAGAREGARGGRRRPAVARRAQLGQRLLGRMGEGPKARALVERLGQEGRAEAENAAAPGREALGAAPRRRAQAFQPSGRLARSASGLPRRVWA